MADVWYDKEGNKRDTRGRIIGKRFDDTASAVAKGMEVSPAAISAAKVSPTDEAPPKRDPGESLGSFAARRRKWQTDRAKAQAQKEALAE